MEKAICEHIENLDHITFPVVRECAECVKTGDSWMHLRTCQTCGATHCCDDSPNQHATKHYLHSAHPVVISAEKGERWLWCYKDNSYSEY